MLDEKEISLNKNINKDDKKIAQNISSWYKKSVKEIPNIKLAKIISLAKSELPQKALYQNH